jgi:hypothetical protein
MKQSFGFKVGIVFTAVAFYCNDAKAESHALGVQAGQVMQMDAAIENSDTDISFKGYVARMRYEFRKRDARVAMGGYLQSFRAENTYKDPSNEHAEEKLASNGLGLHIGLLVGGAGEFDLGFGYQPTQFKKVSGSADQEIAETHTYASGFNINSGLTVAPALGSVAMPIRLQLDCTFLSGGKASGENDAMLRKITLSSKSILIGLDILY